MIYHPADNSYEYPEIACRVCGGITFHFPDGEECENCGFRPTVRAVDEGDSAPSQAESTPEHLPIEEADTNPPLRN